MAFESLGEKLQGVFKKLRGKGKVSEADVKEAMREVKLALLEADVNFKVVKEFVKTVSEKAAGSEVLESLTPGQQIIKIVNEELTALMGGAQARLTFSNRPPSVFMLVGCKARVRRRRAQSLLVQCASSLINGRCLLRATYIVQQRLNSLRSWAPSSISLCLQWAMRKIPSILLKLRSNMRQSMATTRSLLIRPGGYT